MMSEIFSIEIMIMIISFLPLDDAFRLCSLRKKWFDNRLWLYSANIFLDEQSFMHHHAREYLILQGKPYQSFNLKIQGKTHFIEFVDLLILHLMAPEISFFHLSMFYMPVLLGTVDKWIEFAVSRSVRKLSLDFSDGDLLRSEYPSLQEDTDDLAVQHRYYELPRVFYEMGVSVTFLNLMFCGLGSYFNFETFVNLQTLLFHHVAVENEQIVHVLTCCPMLETLKLSCCLGLIEVDLSRVRSSSGLKRLVIRNCGPISFGIQLSLQKLEYFEYIGKLVWFQLEEMPNMTEIAVEFTEPNPNPFTASEMQLCLTGITDTHILTLSGSTLQVMPNEYLLGQQIFPESRLEHLSLKVTLERNEVPGIICLLRSCPCLNWLAIVIDLPEDSDDDDLEYEYPELPSEIWNSEGFQLPELETVDVEGFTGNEYEVELLKLILKTSEKLCEVRIIVEEVEEDGDVPAELYESVTAEFQKIKFASEDVCISWE